MRVIFDSNVLIRTLLDEYSFSGQALLKASPLHAEVHISNSTIAEAIEVVMRQKFDRYLSRNARQLFLEVYEANASKEKITRQIKACRDPKDDMYLELAVSGKADCIITNDEDLLTLNPFEDISIVAPKEFLDRY
ncbi:MAG: putative toxin-antitoxin system toxin component, PIN family [Cyclobacteriaceae bacterium]|nr:putative toxin-antitoxin system toxin component, PIN family [Cyclobacteriaceae bacterium]